MIRKWAVLFLVLVVLLMTGCTAKSEIEDSATYLFPCEEALHEGTWLTWPHKYAYKQTYYFGEEGIDGEIYVEMLEPTWIE
ncbi:MAG: hypothetical protein IKU55_03955, partial [Clostridia bacterium]|nr:hypothetical protein [Clostridia bacterium]